MGGGVCVTTQRKKIKLRENVGWVGGYVVKFMEKHVKE